MARLVLIFLLFVSGMATAAEPTLQCRIHFVDDPPYQKRWLPWQEDHCRIAFEIVNNSDNTYRILKPDQCSGCGYQVVAVSYWGTALMVHPDSTYMSDESSYTTLQPSDTITGTVDVSGPIDDFIFWGAWYEVYLEFFLTESVDPRDGAEVFGPPRVDTLPSNRTSFRLTASTTNLIEHYWTADERDSEDLATLIYYRVFEEPNEFYRMMSKNGSAYHHFLYSSLPRKERRHLGNEGFSLVELLIVLVIIGILAGIAIPRYMASTVKAKQTEAKELLHQVYLMERSYFQNNDQYWIPAPGVTATKDNPYAFDTLGVEIMKSARYKYTISGDQDHFVAKAVADRLDDDPAVDQWEIDETGQLRVVIDDAIMR